MGMSSGNAGEVLVLLCCAEDCSVLPGKCFTPELYPQLSLYFSLDTGPHLPRLASNSPCSLGRP